MMLQQRKSFTFESDAMSTKIPSFYRNKFFSVDLWEFILNLELENDCSKRKYSEQLQLFQDVEIAEEWAIERAQKP